MKTTASVIASAALIVYSFVPVALATDAEISGNGSSSENSIELTKTNTSTVVQSNVATIKNEVESKANTGSNDANDNTGGTVVVNTGAAINTTHVTNQANLNQASLNNCCGNGGLVKITGNGSSSENEVELNSTTDASAFQTNVADIKNDLETKASSGYNDANRNTGGSVGILTGAASNTSTVNNLANANVARVGTGTSGTSTPTNVLISGNGSNSENEFEQTLYRATDIVQNNMAHIYNDVDANAVTGKNDANDNTKGNSMISTGLATALATVDNKVNFNGATATCDTCLLDPITKIDGNGSGSENEIEANLTAFQSIFQDSIACLFDPVDANANSGSNDLNRNTGPANDDQILITGAANSATHVSSTSNANVVGDILPIQLPSGVQWTFSLNLGSLSWLFAS